MNADQRRFKHENVTQRIIGVFFDVYNELGYGFLESVYREAMVIALESADLQVEKEFVLEARFRGRVVGVFKADLLVNGCVIVELKALDAWHSRTIVRIVRPASNYSLALENPLLSGVLSAFICGHLLFLLLSRTEPHSLS